MVTIQVISKKHLSHARLRLFLLFRVLAACVCAKRAADFKKFIKCARIGNLITRR